MAGETPFTIIGNLTADPEMRFTSSGVAVASFTIASTPRTFNRQSNQWEDGTTLFMRCSVWREAAENVAESLTKGTRVVCQGRLVQRDYQTNQGEQRHSIEMQVDEIGPSLRYATAQITRNERGGQGQGYGGYQRGNGGGQPQGGGQYGGRGPQGGAPGPRDEGGQYGGPAGQGGGDPWATTESSFDNGGPAPF